MNRSTPGLPVHHQLPEFTQTHAHRVGDAIQPSHPLSSLSPPALNPSQHQAIPQYKIKDFLKKNTRLYSDSDSLGLDGAQAPEFSTVFPQPIQKYGHVLGVKQGEEPETQGRHLCPSESCAHCWHPGCG